MSSFLVSKEDVKNFVNVPTMSKGQGVYFAYSAPPEVLQQIIPPPLEMVAPAIVGYIVQFGSTNFGGPYMESCITVPCKYKNDVGAYAFNLMLCGHGAESGTIVGSNLCGIPKKRADHIEIARIDGCVTAKIVRHGVTLLDCKIDLGKYNTSIASAYLGDPAPGAENTGDTFFHTFNMNHTDKGNSVFSDVNLVKLVTKTKSVSWEPGTLSIKTQSSNDDPIGELAVVQPIGGAYFENEYIEMCQTVKLAQLDTDETMPYLMSGRYDRAMMGHKSTYLTSYEHK